MPTWDAGDFILGLLGLIVGGSGIGGVVAFLKFFRDRGKDAIGTEQAEVELTKMLRDLSREAIADLKAEMERLEEVHASQISSLRAQMKQQESTHTQERAALIGRLQFLTEILRQHDIPVPLWTGPFSQP